MNIRTHFDPCVLEDELLRRIDHAHAAREPGATYVLVPTLRLATHVQCALLKERPAWLGLEILSFRSLARRILQAAGRPTPSLLGPALYRETVRAAVDEFPDSVFADRVRRRPGTLARLVATFQELRDAGIDAETAAPYFDDETRELSSIYAAVESRLSEALAAGWTDDAGLVEAALPLARAHAETRAAIFLHGAAELTGVHTELLRELDRGRSVEVYLLHDAHSPAYAFAKRFADEFLAAGEGVSFETLETPQTARSRACGNALYDEELVPPKPDGVTASYAHSQGPAAELFEAMQQAIGAVAEGAAPGRIALIARTLEPYAAAIEEAAADREIPIESSLTGPLRRHPRVGDFLAVLRAVADDFPRRPTVSLLRSPRLRWQSLPGVDRSPSGLRADEWSRETKIVGGLSEWRSLLPTARYADDRTVDRTLQALESLRTAFPDVRRSWSEHAERLRARLAFWFDPQEDAGPDRRGIEGLLDEMGRLESVLGRTDRVSLGAMVHWLEQEIGGTSVSIPQVPGGIQVLDAMQARGMTFDRVFLLGMNSGVFPRPPREDALLSDGPRERLRRDSAKPLPIKRHGSDEERWLLASILGSARESVHVSWQRADESGRARTASLALREIARWTGEKPEIDDAIDRAVHIPSHPLQAVEDKIDRHGLISPDESRLQSALRRGESERSVLVEDFPELSDGIRMLQATQSFDPEILSFDGRVGPPAELRPIAVSTFEKLSQCPLQFFFKHRLRIRAAEDEADPLELTNREIGIAVHDTMEAIYDRLSEDGFLEKDPAAALAHAEQLLEQDPSPLLGAFGERLRRRLPIFGRRFDEIWRTAILRFMAEDLPRIVEEGWRIVNLEGTLEGPLSVDDREVRLTGRLDRLLQRGELRRVGDYKTSGKFADRVNPTKLLRGEKLQVPLYSFMSEGAEVELLGIGPAYEDSTEAERRTLFNGWSDELAASFDETLSVLGRLALDGLYPLNKGQHCNWCDFRNGCRRDHPPTETREQRAEDRRPLDRLRKKSRKTPNPPTAQGDTA